MDGTARGSQHGIGHFWERYEGPTWVVAAIVYGWWGALIWYHASIPWWLMVPLGALVIAWHNSLQHETIHALTRVPRPVRFALALPPLGLVIPFSIYRRSHRRHHRDEWLTDPAQDPESYYHSEHEWMNYAPAIRAVYLFNQTLLGRLTVGPLLSLGQFLKRETQRILSGDRSNLGAWAWHVVCVGVVLFWIREIAGMPLWQYVLFVVYPGLSLSMLRSFCEHRYAVRSGHRTAIVESGFPFNILFLNNNLHAVHHLSPALPWYRIPAVWRESRAKLLEGNGDFYFTGYAQIGAAHGLRPTFTPAQPQGSTRGSIERLGVRAAGTT